MKKILSCLTIFAIIIGVCGCDKANQTSPKVSTTTTAVATTQKNDEVEEIVTAVAEVQTKVADVSAQKYKNTLQLNSIDKKSAKVLSKHGSVSINDISMMVVSIKNLKVKDSQNSGLHSLVEVAIEFSNNGDKDIPLVEFCEFEMSSLDGEIILKNMSNSDKYNVDNVLKDSDIIPANSKYNGVLVFEVEKEQVDILKDFNIYYLINDEIFVSKTKVVDFKDELFEIMVRKSLDVERNENITSFDLEDVESLLISNKFLFSLYDISRINGARVYLKEDYLDWYTDMYSYKDMQIKTFQDIGNFKNLKALIITKDKYNYDGNGKGNTPLNIDEILVELNNLPNASNIEMLSVLTTTYGFTSDHKIDNLPDLSNFTSLRELDLSNNRFKNISNISKNKNLEYLNLNYNDIEDCSALGELKKLEFLSLNNNKISDVSPLSQLHNLKILSFDHQGKASDGYMDLMPLFDNLSNLRCLNISSNKIKDITGISKLTNLEILDAWSIKVDNFNKYIDEFYTMDKLFVLVINSPVDESELDNIEHITGSLSGFPPIFHQWDYNILQKYFLQYIDKWK